MNGFDSLELNTETLRELTGDELAHVAAGAAWTTTCQMPTQTPVCPSGATWFAPCHGESIQVCVE